MKTFKTITKFEQFTNFLEREIKNGAYPLGSKLPSERDLGAKYKMSYMTANKAVSALVSKGMLKRTSGRNGTYVLGIKEEIAERMIGAVINIEEMHAPFPSVLTAQLQRKKYFTALFDISHTPSLKENIEKFLKEKPKALIVDGYSIFPFETLKRFPAETQLVFVHRFEGPKEFNASYILSDYTFGGELVTRHLLNLGRKRIMIISPKMSPGWTSDLFYKGCQKAFKEKKLKPLCCIDSTNATEKTYEDIFVSSQIPDAVISFGDYLVIPAVKVLKKLKLKIPDDVAIVGYQNTPWATAYHLTSVNIRPKLIIEKTMEAIGKNEKKKITIKPEIVFRESCPQ